MKYKIIQLFNDNMEIKSALAESLSDVIAQAAQRLVTCLLSDHKMLACGNGGSAANIQHFTTAMIHHFEVARPALPVFSLSNDPSVISAIANETHSGDVFAKQIQALGHNEDVLLIVTTTGNADSLLHAVNAANERGLDMLVLSGRDGGLLANHLGPEDIEIRIPIDNSARIREMHLFILHCICSLIEQSLFGTG